jgi:hypothetical protein
VLCIQVENWYYYGVQILMVRLISKFYMLCANNIKVWVSRLCHFLDHVMSCSSDQDVKEQKVVACFVVQTNCSFDPSLL